MEIPDTKIKAFHDYISWLQSQIEYSLSKIDDEEIQHKERYFRFYIKMLANKKEQLAHAQRIAYILGIETTETER